jgi:hypothetical protein
MHYELVGGDAWYWTQKPGAASVVTDKKLMIKLYMAWDKMWWSNNKVEVLSYNKYMAIVAARAASYDMLHNTSIDYTLMFVWQH